MFGFNIISKTKLQYQLNATTIPLSLLLTNQDKLSYTLLPEIGINWSFPREIFRPFIQFYWFVFLQYWIRTRKLSRHVNHCTFLCEIIFVNTIYTTIGNIYDFVWNKSVTISCHQHYSVCFSTGSGVRCAFLLTTNAIVYIPEIAALPKLHVNDIFNQQQALICTLKKTHHDPIGCQWTIRDKCARTNLIYARM